MIVVTGASGLLGAAVLWKARDSGREVAGICHRNALEIPGTPMVSVDLTDQAAAREVLEKLRPAGIVHCAAATNVDWCEDHPVEATRINQEASGSLAEIASGLNARLVHISTDAVFDGKRGSYSEEDEACPLNVYAKSKLDGELEVLRRCPAAVVVRANIYGWNAQPKQSLAEWVLSQLQAGRAVPGFTDARFAPLLVNDMAEMILMLLDGAWTGIYHAASADSITKYEFARAVARVFDFEVDRIQPARLRDAHLHAPRPLNTSLSPKKLESALDCAMPVVVDGVRKFRVLRENGYAERLKTHLRRS